MMAAGLSLAAAGAAAADLTASTATAAPARKPPHAASGTPGSGFVITPDGTQIFYKDWGPLNAQPIVFHHGWPLSADDWDNQMLFFLGQGYRVIAHDRRGHGRSTQTDTGNDMEDRKSVV